MTDQNVITVQSNDVLDAVDRAGAGDALASQPLLISVPKASRLLEISRPAAYRCAACGDCRPGIWVDGSTS